MPTSTSTPAETLPANFFDKQTSSQAPDSLPANFFDSKDSKGSKSKSSNPSKPSKGFWSSLGETLNPVNLAGGLVKPYTNLYHEGRQVLGIEPTPKAIPVSEVPKRIAYGTPIIGSSIRDVAEEGDYGAAAGHLTGNLALLAVLRKIGGYEAVSEGESISRGTAGEPQSATVKPSLVSKLPNMGPGAKFVAKHLPIPGLRTVIDAVDYLKSKYGPDLQKLPKMGRDELANQLYKETYGADPKTAVERVRAIKDLQTALKAKAKVAPPPLRGSSAARYAEPAAKAGPTAEAGPAGPAVESTSKPKLTSKSASTSAGPASTSASADPASKGLSDRELGMRNIDTKTQLKNRTIAKRLVDENISPDDIADPALVSDAQLNQIVVTTKHPITGKPYEGFRGSGGASLHRTPTEGRAEIVREMRKLKGIKE